MRSTLYIQKMILLVITSMIYIVFSIKAQMKILKGKYVKQSRIVVNSILTWILPFGYWMWARKEIIGRPTTITKPFRDKIIASRVCFNESGVGIYGA